MIVHLCPWNTRMEIEQAYKKYEQIKQNLWTSLWPVDLTLDYKTDLQWTFFVWSMLVISHRSEYLKVSKRHMHNAHNSIKSGDKSIKYRTMSVFKIVVSPVYKQWYFTKPPCDSCFEARIEKIKPLYWIIQKIQLWDSQGQFWPRDTRLLLNFLQINFSSLSFSGGVTTMRMCG